jgi:ribose transport system substrate-binding protein
LDKSRAYKGEFFITIWKNGGVSTRGAGPFSKSTSRFERPMGKKVTVLLFLLFGLAAVWLVGQLNAILGNIAGRPSERGRRPAARYRIALIYPDSNPAFWRSITAGARSAARNQPVYVNFMKAVHGQELQMADYLRLAVVAGYDGIIVPGDDERIVPLIQMAWDSGIPTLMIASDLPDSPRLGYVGANNYRVGYVAGKKLLEGMARREPPRFAILSQLTGANMQLSVAESLKVFGFREAISAGGTIVPIWEKSNPTLIDSLIVVRSLLRKYPDLNGIYATYPEGTLAAARVAAERDAAKLRIIGHGDSTALRTDIRNGVVQASIVEYPYRMGNTAVREMLRYFREGRVHITSNIRVNLIDRAQLSRPAPGGRP